MVTSWTLPGQIRPRELSFSRVNVWRAAADLARAGASGALATVARVRGSTPVPAGTKMLVGAEGRLIGSVGGGCVEAEVICAALEARAQRPPALPPIPHSAALAGALGLPGGGPGDFFGGPRRAEEPYVRVLEAAATAEAGLVRTATEWSSARPLKTFEPLARAALT